MAIVPSSVSTTLRFNNTAIIAKRDAMYRASNVQQYEKTKSRKPNVKRSHPARQSTCAAATHCCICTEPCRAVVAAHVVEILTVGYAHQREHWSPFAERQQKAGNCGGLPLPMVPALLKRSFTRSIRHRGPGSG